jgi:hypothetical protein
LIRLDRVETTDGTVYRNLYYASDWSDLEFAEEYNTYSHLFLYLHEGEFTELELKAEDIKEISLGDNPANNNFLLGINDDTGGYVFINDDIIDQIEMETPEGTLEDQMEEIKEYCQKFFDKATEAYDLADHDSVVKNLVALCTGYVRSYLEKQNPPATDDEAFTIGFAETIKVMIFADERLNKSKGDPLLRAHVSAIVPHYIKFINLHPNLVEILPAEKAPE